MVFFIDEDAYLLLGEYLSGISDRFPRQEEREEILPDIETRIAEIFTDRLGGKRQVVTLEDVKAMISLLGRPEDIFEPEEGEDPSSGTASPDPQTSRSSRRLFRDPDNAVLGGVCGGLGAYFNLDPVWFRVAFILLALAYGSSILVYLVMWLIIPEARSTAQRLEMKGEPVNLNNISKNINKEFTKVKDNIRNIPESEGYRRSRNVLQELFHVLGEIILMLLKVIGVIIGVTFVLAGLIILVALVSTFFFHFTQFFPELTISPYYYMPDILTLFTKPENVPYILGSLILTLGIPLTALIYAGIKMIFNIRTRHPVLGVTFLVVWLISAISLSLFIADIASGYSRGARISKTVPLDSFSTDTLYLTAPSDDDHFYEELLSLDDHSIFRDPGSGVLLSRPELDIVLTGSGKPELEIYKRARGNTRQAAVRHAEDIDLQWETRDKVIILRPWYRFGKRWYVQEADYRLRVPAGMVICLDENLRRMLDYIPNDQHLHSYDLAGKCWIMTEEGLKEVR